MLVGVLAYAHAYLDPRSHGIPGGLDAGIELSYEASIRSAVGTSGRIPTWFYVAYDGMPLLGHPISHLFYLPFSVPVLVFGPEVGARGAYVISLGVAAACMYGFARTLGAGRWAAAWAGLLFAMSGILGARLFAGHIAKVLTIPLIPLALTAALRSVGPRPCRPTLWAALAGLVTGITLLAGEPYVPLYLGLAVPVVMLIAGWGSSRGRIKHLCLVIGIWLITTVLAAATKLLGGIELLTSARRSVSAFDGSQDWYWAAVHLVYPFFAYGPMMPGQVLPALPYGGSVPGAPTPYGWWEYTQYIGVIAALCALVGVGGALAAPARHRGQLAMAAVVGLGALWLAAGFDYSPVHWLLASSAFLQQLRIPSRGLVLVGVGSIALAAVGLDTIQRWAAHRRGGRPAVAILGLLALADVFVISWWIPRISEGPDLTAIGAVAERVQGSDRGPFLMDVGDFGAEYPLVVETLVERGIRVANPLAPLVPNSQDMHQLIGPERRIRYLIAPLTAESTTDLSRWRLADQQDNVALYVNDMAAGDGWLVENGEVTPLAALDAGPTWFIVRASALNAGAVVIPANALSGWSVSVDDGAPRTTTTVDGYVATGAQTGEHLYRFSYLQPLAPVLALLGLLPWLAFGLCGAFVFWQRRRPLHSSRLAAT